MLTELDIIEKLKKDLLILGWKFSDNADPGYDNTALFEVGIDIGIQADCVLYVDNKAIAIIEVKQNNKSNDILNALEQAQKYANNYTTLLYPAAWSNPIPFIFAYNGKQIVFRDLKDKNSNPKEIKKFYSAEELKKMLYTIPYGPTNVTNNINTFLKYLKFAILLIFANSSDLAVQKYFESRFSEDKFYVVGNKEYGIKRVLQFAYYLFTEVYLLNPQNDIFNINNKLLKDININDFSDKDIKIELFGNSENLINIHQGQRIIQVNPNKIMVNFAEGFVRDAESYAIPIYEKFKNSGEQYIKFGIKGDEKDNSNFIFKIIQKFTSDKPTQIDYLDRESDAVRLASFIANKNTQTPFNLAIISGWGNGKSSFINFMVNHLKSINSSFTWRNKLFFNKKNLNNSEYKETKIIKFNAWQYNNDAQIGFALLDSIYSEVNLWNKFVLVIKKTINIKNVCSFILLFLSVLSLCYVFQSNTFFNNIILDKDNLNIFIKALTLLIGGGMIAFILNTFKHISNLIGEIFSFKYNKIFKENIDIKYTIKDNICNCLKNLNNNKKRIVIFIDDLDRCSEQSIISLLDTLIIYFSDDCDVVVVLNIDIAIILKAISSKLNNINSKKNETQAIKYLDKILQANYNIPKILSSKYENIISKLLPIQERKTNTTVIDKNNDVNLKENNKLTIEKEVTTEQNINNSQTVKSEIIQELPVDVIEELKFFLKEYGELLEYNPRKIKRVINILKLLVNDLTYNNIEYDAENLVANICILENYPELSIYINKIFKNDEEFNTKDINVENIQNNDKVISLLNQYLSLIDKTQYYYIRKYIYDLSLINLL